MTAGGALITSHLVKGPLRFSPHPFGARLQAGCAPRAASGLTLDQANQRGIPNMCNYVITCMCMCALSTRRLSAIYVQEHYGRGAEERKKIAFVA